MIACTAGRGFEIRDALLKQGWDPEGLSGISATWLCGARSCPSHSQPGAPLRERPLDLRVEAARLPGPPSDPERPLAG